LNDENIVKKTCKELGMTYKELGEAIGYSESNLRKTVSDNKVSKQLEKSITMFIEINNLKKELQEYQTFKNMIKNMSRG